MQLIGNIILSLTTIFFLISIPNLDSTAFTHFSAELIAILIHTPPNIK